ncbi:JDVT-CTERM system glutamic-type intramembrane protease [Pseudoduganella sp. LjRoot289]|uniref:JDVT-CTERM system glutamic-type intramembrane protease MrtJ n=1 Tax=Pseudoduganella sp. LjRoot289 TaxID=3342314 RepID=UPI003ECD0680
MPVDTALLALPALCGAPLLKTDPATLLRLLLLAPLLEEWIVRAGLQEWLMRRSPLPAPARGAGSGSGSGSGSGRTVAVLTVLIPAACFSLLHIGAGWGAAAAVFLPGLALGLLYRRWRDWRLCAAVHALCNGYALTFCNTNF